MKNDKLIYVLMSFLSFSVLFAGIYFIITKEAILGITMIVLGLVSIIVIYFLLTKPGRGQINVYDNDDSEEHYQKLVPKQGENFLEEDEELDSDMVFEEITIPLDDEDNDYDLDEYDDLDEEIDEVLDEVAFGDVEEEEKTTVHEIDIVVSEAYEENLESFMSDMINQKMFLETQEYRYDQEEIRKFKLENRNLYKYEYHPIPLISLVRDPQNTKSIKVMMGMNNENIVHIGFVSQADSGFVNKNYGDIKDIKADLSGGTYRILKKHADIIQQDTAAFVVTLKIYI